MERAGAMGFGPLAREQLISFFSPPQEASPGGAGAAVGRPGCDRRAHTRASAARAPGAQERRQVGAIDEAVVVQIGLSPFAPVAQERREVGAVDEAVAVEVGRA